MIVAFNDDDLLLYADRVVADENGGFKLENARYGVNVCLSLDPNEEMQPDPVAAPRGVSFAQLDSLNSDDSESLLVTVLADGNIYEFTCGVMAPVEGRLLIWLQDKDRENAKEVIEKGYIVDDEFDVDYYHLADNVNILLIEDYVEPRPSYLHKHACERDVSLHVDYLKKMVTVSCKGECDVFQHYNACFNRKYVLMEQIRAFLDTIHFHPKVCHFELLEDKSTKFSAYYKVEVLKGLMLDFWVKEHGFTLDRETYRLEYKPIVFPPRTSSKNQCAGSDRD